jgi:hypothetical protein
MEPIDEEEAKEMRNILEKFYGPVHSIAHKFGTKTSVSDREAATY